MVPALVVCHSFSTGGPLWYRGGAAAANAAEFTGGAQALFNRRGGPQIILAGGARAVVGLSTSAEIHGGCGNGGAPALVQLIDTAWLANAGAGAAPPGL